VLHIEQKQGKEESLDGRLTVYAVVDIDNIDMLSSDHPVATAVHNGFLVAQGNYRDQNNLRDFLKSEMGLSLEEGLEEIIDKLNGLESALDPAKLREKIESMKDLEDFIPTPAKIVPFHSAEEILAQEGDIYFAGVFKNLGNANLSVNAFPILYQARYREQQLIKVQSEIESLISQIEQSGDTGENCLQPGMDVAGKIVKEYIPGLLYARKDKHIDDTVVTRFRQFMRGYKFHEDTDAIVNIIEQQGDLSESDYSLLELYAKKINEVIKENFSEVEKITHQIYRLESGSEKSS